MLTREEIVVLVNRAGFWGNKKKTYKTLAKTLNCSTNKVSNLYSLAVRKLYRLAYFMRENEVLVMETHEGSEETLFEKRLKDRTKWHVSRENALIKRINGIVESMQIRNRYNMKYLDKLAESQAKRINANTKKYGVN